MAFRSGENVGAYRIVEQLGQGGMASVFKAYHPALDRFVALKVLHPAFLEDPNFLARFQREARVVAKLEHPNIVSVYDFAEHEGQPYLVMKFIEGRSMKAALAEGPLSQGRGLEIVTAAGEALGYAHRQGILHRDIKPSNILLGDDGAIYLADFGLARIAQAGQSTLSGDVILGTPQYISPEQARGQEDLDEGTDIYSLGVVIYEIVVGEVPFNADTPFSIIHDHIYAPLPLPRQVNPSVPEQVERVLLKALAKERRDRFDSVEDLVAAFRGAVTEGRETVPLEALPPQVPAESQPRSAEGEKRPSRRRWLWAAGGLVLACLCLFSFLAVVNNAEERQAAENATATVLAIESGVASGETAAPMEDVDDPRVVAARATVAADPDNPESQIQLAESLAAAGLERRAAVVSLGAADLYRQDGAFLEAAQVLTQALAWAGGPQVADPRLREMLAESLFHSAPAPREAGALISDLEKAYPGWAPLPAISARIAIYNGDVLGAISALEGALMDRPRDPLLHAVLAEAYLLEGRSAEARDHALEARSTEGNPPWLDRHLDQLIERIVAN